jgi:hypothetical protein
LLNGTGSGTTSYIGSTPYAQFGSATGAGCTFLSNGSLVCRGTNASVTEVLNFAGSITSGGITWQLGDSTTKNGVCGIASGGSGACFSGSSVLSGLEFAAESGGSHTFRINGTEVANITTVGVQVEGGTAQFQSVPGNFSTLSSCTSGREGTMAAVNDSTTNTWGATITGSGSNHVLAYCDGTNWTVAAK